MMAKGEQLDRRRWVHGAAFTKENRYAAARLERKDCMRTKRIRRLGVLVELILDVVSGGARTPTSHLYVRWAEEP
jgi:hypothetical protein